MVAEIRPSPIAGIWYSADAKILAAQIDGFLADAAVEELDGELVAVIVPHAGYRYSGRTAGYAFHSMMGLSPELVVVVSPLHGYHPADVLTTRHRAYGTPLGTIKVGQDALRGLKAAYKNANGEDLATLANDDEHSLEIELPFLQRALAGDFQLLPVMVRSVSPAVLLELGRSLASVAKGKKTLLVASTDLSHFYPEKIANELDREMLAQIEAFSPDGVLDAERRGTGFACGAGAVAAVLWAAKFLGANKVKVLHYSTSADETGDRRSVVGYGAAVVLKQV
ncbi:MAG: AmmeMemoRadiSam system protein B [Anaerolineaceae bacterium]|nr:AmmeMemoRadiSam system protein B [Anaerolineaceae bacterium]